MNTKTACISRAEAPDPASRPSQRVLTVAAVASTAAGLHQVWASGSFISHASIDGGAMQFVLAFLMYRAVKKLPGQQLLASWLRYVVLGYLGIAALLRVAMSLFPLPHALNHAAALLAAALGVLGSCIAFQQLNLSLPQLRQCRTVAELALRTLSFALVVQSLIELAAIWCSVTGPGAPASMFAVAFVSYTIAGVSASLLLLVSIHCADVSFPFQKVKSRSLP